MKDYFELFEQFPFPIRQVKRVFLIYCLNDIYFKSSSELQDALNKQNVDKKMGLKERFVGFLKNSSFRSIHKWLRIRSVFYLWLRDKINSQQKRYWKAVSLLYEKENQTLEKNFMYLTRLSRKLNQLNIDLTVILSPYAEQMGTATLK